MNRDETFKTILKHRQHKSHRRKTQDTEPVGEKHFTEKIYERLALRKYKCEKTRDFFIHIIWTGTIFLLYTNISIKTGELVQAEGGWDDLQKLSSLELKLFYGKEAMTLQHELRMVNPYGENIFLGTWIIDSSMVQW